MTVKRIWGFIGSRTFAVWVLFLIILILTFSAFLPNQFTLTDEELLRLQKERPFLWKLSTYLSTPSIVTSIPFVVIAFFLGLSTFLCTIKRLKTRKRDFSKRRAFHASLSGRGATLEKVLKVLVQRGWHSEIERSSETINVIRANKGAYGFWGSIIFHGGLIVIFITAIISSISRFNAEIIAPEDTEVSMREESNYLSIAGSRPPDINFTVRDIRLEAKEAVPTQLSALLIVGSQSFNIAVNRPATLWGYQFSPSRYGVSPRFVIRKKGVLLFDSYVNLRSLFVDDYFEVKEEGLRLLVRFFPDFYREKGKIGTRGFEEKNPVFFVRVYKEGLLLKDLFVRPGDSPMAGDYVISIPEYSHWISLIVSRDPGTFAFIIAFVISLAGLIIRFISNERVITVIHYADGRFDLRAWSRYYPAFLEKELLEIGDEVKE